MRSQRADKYHEGQVYTEGQVCLKGELAEKRETGRPLGRNLLKLNDGREKTTHASIFEHEEEVSPERQKENTKR